MRLASEIVLVLPDLMGKHPNGPRVPDIARHLACPEGNVRKALEEIREAGLAIVVRYPGAKSRHLVPLGHRFAKITTANRRRVVVCRWCDTLFQNGSKQFCSKSCFAQHMWSKPERREKGSASGKRAAQLPSRKAVTAKLVALQRSPEGRKRQSERNRLDWADPVHKAKRAASIQAVNGTQESRRKFAEHFKKNWQDPEVREKACQRMREVRAEPAVKERYSEASKRRWKNPDYLAKMEKAAKAFGERSRGRKQTPEEKAKRVETRRKNTLARGYYRHPGEKTRPYDLRKRDEKLER